MKFLTFLSLLTLCSALHAQSYWFGGMTRVPGGTEGSVGSFVIGGQNNSAESKLNVNENVGGTVTSINKGEELLGFSTFQLGVEGAYAWPVFELEGGLDLGFSDMSTDLKFDGVRLDSFIDSFIGLNLKFGGVLKYDFEPSDDLIITPYLRSGISLEYVTNEISLPTYNYYTGTYNYYSPSYLGESFGNSMFNFSIGTALRWNGFISNIAFGKYQLLSGDMEDLKELDPAYFRISLGYEFTESLAFQLGYKTEWYDDSSAEWTGWAIDGNFEFRY